jgi:tetratricopeptide (TPR) repeat protein
MAAAGLAVVVCLGRGQMPGDDSLNQAYKAVAQKDYDTAIDWFRRGLALQPHNARAHKDLAYTLLKAGENGEARDEFESALRLNPQDETAALEYAFLAFETNKPIEARRAFDRLRRNASPATRATAEQAFENIDRPLDDGIARWKQALARSANPNDISMFSAHWELARLAELRDDLPLAAEQYEICRQLKPQTSEILLILARVWQQLNRVQEARAALLAASRSSDSRTAELGLEQWGSRYPYPYEFLNALKIDPKNIPLRRELGFLYLAMNKNAEAVAQFELILAIDPHDELTRRQLDALRGIKSRPDVTELVPEPPASSAASGADAKSMGKKSFALGYVRDAIKYLRQAHEQNPDDAEVMLQLGWAYNQAKDDADALQWFDRARHSDDPQIASEAAKAYHTLNGDTLPQTTVWMLPMFSSRWKDAFTYGQVKRTFPLPWKRANKLVSFYLSTRFEGDARGRIVGAIGPEYLSQDSLTFGVGVASRTWHHLTALVEAGEAVKYLPNQRDWATPSYRADLNYVKGFGKLLGAAKPGLFFETVNDAVYVGQFDKDTLFISQNHAGRTFRLWGSSAQFLFNVNNLRDLKGEPWANTFEVGPGFKLHLSWMPPNVYFSVDALRGFYTNGPYTDYTKNPALLMSHYTDIKVGFWYARTK